MVLAHLREDRDMRVRIIDLDAAVAQMLHHETDGDSRMSSTSRL